MTRIAISVLMIILLLSSGAMAGEYKLVKGSQYQLCRDYQKNLNSFSEEKYPMVCERRLNPKMTDFREVKWKEIDAKKNIHLFVQMLKDEDSYKRLSDEMRQKALQKQIDRVEAGKEKLYTARFDIDNDGKKDLVLRARIVEDDWLSCTPTNKFTISNGEYPVPNLYIMSDEKNIDMKWSKPLHSFSYTAFTYQGRTFLSVWDGGASVGNPRYVPGKGGGQVYVYEPNSIPEINEWVAINVCTYEYHQ